MTRAPREHRADRADLPVPHLVLWRQFALGLLLFGYYLLVDASATPARAAAARQHGHALFDLEQRLHIDIERTLNHALAGHHVLATLANYEYASTYILSALALLAWVWVKRRDLWLLARDSFLILNILAISCFALFPTAPPRMLSALGFVDTVTRGGTVGSWGSSWVSGANQLAAMPSLHVGWALWVSVVLARINGSRWVQVLSAVHVALTVYVVMATANHYLLDAVAVVIPVLIGVRLSAWWHEVPGDVVAPADAFFLHVEETGAPHHVGGLVVLDASGDEPSLEAVRALVRGELADLPRFRQRAVRRGRWRRTRWVEVDDVDLVAHVTETGPVGGPDGLRRVMAEVAEQPLPRDRPLWRIVMVRDIAPAGEPRSSALVLLVHHAVADGIGTVLQSLRLFRPRTGVPVPEGSGPGPLLRAAAVTTGLAQLATDGSSRRLQGQSLRRDFAVADVALEDARHAAALLDTRVTDLVLALVAEGVRRLAPATADQMGGTMRCSVPLMVRTPDSSAEGNATAAVMIDVPVDDRPFADRLAAVAAQSRRLRRPTRALASRFVMATGLRLLPEPAVGWFARTVYGDRFFHGVVSNMPGPTATMTFVGQPMPWVYPILPVAPGTVLSLGALSWDGRLGLGVATDPALLDAGALAEHLASSLHRLAGRGVAAEDEEASPLVG